MLKVSGTAAFISRSRRPVSGIAKSVKIRRVCFCRSFCIITDAFFRQSSRLLFQFRTWLFCCQTRTTVECFRCYWVTFLPRRLIILKVALKIYWLLRSTVIKLWSLSKPGGGVEFFVNRLYNSTPESSYDSE